MKTELAIVRVTTDNKKFLDKYQAFLHEAKIVEKEKQDRSWEKMKQNITDMVLEVLQKNRWGIYFKSEPMQVLPVQESESTLFKVNEVDLDEFEQAVKTQIDKESERDNECQEKQANFLPIGKELSNGIRKTLNDTKE